MTNLEMLDNLIKTFGHEDYKVIRFARLIEEGVFHDLLLAVYELYLTRDFVTEGNKLLKEIADGKGLPMW